jgi:ribosomal protein L7/L12
MTGTELVEVRDWLFSEHGFPIMPIIEILNDSIKENFLTVEVPQESKTLPKETVADLVRDGKIISVIKVIREVFGIGLKGSKDFFDLNRAKWEASVKV